MATLCDGYQQSRFTDEKTDVLEIKALTQGDSQYWQNGNSKSCAPDSKPF